MQCTCFKVLERSSSLGSSVRFCFQVMSFRYRSVRLSATLWHITYYHDTGLEKYHFNIFRNETTLLFVWDWWFLLWGAKRPHQLTMSVRPPNSLSTKRSYRITCFLSLFSFLLLKCLRIYICWYNAMHIIFWLNNHRIYKRILSCVLSYPHPFPPHSSPPLLDWGISRNINSSGSKLRSGAIKRGLLISGAIFFLLF